MAFILVPTKGESFYINNWGWRPLVELIRFSGLVTDETYELMGCQCCVEIDAETAGSIAQFIETVLRRIPVGGRVRLDLVVTTREPKAVVIEPGTDITKIDVEDVYSVDRGTLVEFQTFCKGSGGFLIG